ncbi:MAG: hypothetical protein WC613_04495 [Candidatus Aenigmatarchaeota archaeon]
MKKSLLILILLSILILPAIASAQTLTGMVANVARVIVIIAGIITVVLWVVTGVLFLAAQGAPEKLTKAKTALLGAIGGTVIVILAYSGQTIINIFTSALFSGT